MFAGKAGAYLSEASFKVLNSSVGPMPYPQTLNWAEEAAQ